MLYRCVLAILFILRLVKRPSQQVSLWLVNHSFDHRTIKTLCCL